ncbi:MAG: HD domain-containing protein [Eubacterium sp.]|nr:HD domain-containing protein [Eubacterium sp.]
MKNFAKLLKENEDYKAYMKQLAELEQDRKFCRHGEDHLMEVASLAAWAASVCRVPHDPDIIILAAMLHDIGRVYGNAHHDESSAKIAQELMVQIRVPEDIRVRVLDLIEAHRNKDPKKYLIKTYDQLRDALEEVSEVERLAFVFAWADNRVRNCYECKATAECYWSESRKNKEPIYYEVFYL